eukprot:Hpha_TRINITY_DN25966_c0_g1::TRINITY_DN25966_c0_g1_i1::g.185369::m.185369
MPNLKHYLSDGGLEFVNHVAVVPWCGPSRSSFLAGRFPHNVGYVANGAKESVAAFAKVQNDTIGTWMRKQGYHTSFIGKYVNGLECDVPMGWNTWAGLTCAHMKPNPYTNRSGALGGTYNYYNASQWRLHFDDENRQLPTKGGQILTVGMVSTRPSSLPIKRLTRCSPPCARGSLSSSTPRRSLCTAALASGHSLRISTRRRIRTGRTES